MKKLVINGGYPLNGSVKISGAKNAALPMMTASILSDCDIVLNGIPDLADVRTMIILLESMGIKANKNHEDSLTFNASGINSKFASYELVKTMRASFYVLGPLLARFNYTEVSLPGGCAWVPRPVDFHLKALEEMLTNLLPFPLGKIGNSSIGKINILLLTLPFLSCERKVATTNL